jgi:hypothetical protein
LRVDVAGDHRSGQLLNARRVGQGRPPSRPMPVVWPLRDAIYSFFPSGS